MIRRMPEVGEPSEEGATDIADWPAVLGVCASRTIKALQSLQAAGKLHAVPDMDRFHVRRNGNGESWKHSGRLYRDNS